MKFLLFSMAFWSAILPLSAQDVEITESDAILGETGIFGPISDGKPAQPAPAPDPIAFEIKSSVTKRVHVVESPEAPGLPAPEATIKVTVQLVHDPGLTDPVPPLPALPPDDPAVLARLAELGEAHTEMELVFVSATVYDHSRTYLRCYPGNGAGKEITCWSNLDFNHFSGFATYQVKGVNGELRQYGLIMSLGNESTVQEAAPAGQAGDPQVPDIDDLPDLINGGPAFVVTEGAPADLESMAIVAGMHDLYRIEGLRMEDAYRAREKADRDRKKFLLANPPVPKDLTIRFWKRSAPSPASQQLENGGHQ